MLKNHIFEAVTKLIIIPLFVTVSGVLLSLYLYQLIASCNNEKMIGNVLTATLELIDRKQSVINYSNVLPVGNYHPADSLLFYEKPINLEHIRYYDNLLNEPNFYLEMDIQLFGQLAAFRRRDEWLVDDYGDQKTDSARISVRDDIYKQLSYEKEILTAEISFLRGEISRDSLQFVRDTSFRKYL